MSDNCVFCRIAKKEIPSTMVYEDDRVVAFKDLEPQAPVHVLIIPKKHIASLNELAEADSVLIAHVLAEVVPLLADKLGIKESGYRVVTNTGVDGGQTVQHLHFHLLGGRSMQWPPG